MITELLLFTKSPLTPQIEFICTHCTAGIATFLFFKIYSQLIFNPSFLGKLIPRNEEIAFFFCHFCSISIWLVSKCWLFSEYLTESRKVLMIIRYGQLPSQFDINIVIFLISNIFFQDLGYGHHEYPLEKPTQKVSVRRLKKK